MIPSLFYKPYSALSWPGLSLPSSRIITAVTGLTGPRWPTWACDSSSLPGRTSSYSQAVIKTPAQHPYSSLILGKYR